MPSFPSLSFNRAFVYPLTRTATRKTTIIQFVGDGEQKWVSQLPVSSFQITLTDVDSESLSIMRNFWSSQGGASTSTFDLTLNGVTYNHCLFVDDTFAAVQNKPNRWSVQFSIRQTRV